MRALVRHPLIDEILDARRDFARGHKAAFAGYRNHAHRVYNFARSITSWPPDDEDKAAIAAAEGVVQPSSLVERDELWSH